MTKRFQLAQIKFLRGKVKFEMNKNFILFSCLLCLFLVSYNFDILADHGSGGGGGCSGDCAPPTLGEDNSGREYVKGGFSINEKSFEVNQFKQDITTQIVNAGEPVTVTLRIYENSGTQYLSHVGLLLGLEEKTIEGVKVHSHHVQIIWEQNLEGEVSINVEDSQGLVSEVDVKQDLIRDAFGTVDRVNQLQFEFTPQKPFDAQTILVEMWDYERNSWTNYFTNSIKIEELQSKEGDLPQSLSSEPLVPSWFKTNAAFWSNNQIDDETFSNGIKFLIKEKIMNIPNLKEFEPKPQLHFIDPEKGPQHYIDRYYNDEFYKDWFDTNYPDYTIEEAVGYVSNLEIPEWVKTNAHLWTTDMITDREFIAGIEFLIENGIILL